MMLIIGVCAPRSIETQVVGILNDRISKLMWFVILNWSLTFSTQQCQSCDMIRANTYEQAQCVCSGVKFKRFL